MHAKLSPSSSARWLSCTGSVKAEQAFPSSTTSYAVEGTTAHSLAERCLTEDITPNYYLNKQLDGYTVDEEMIDNVAAYVAYVKSFPGIHFYEVRVDFSEWIPDGFGTSDAIVIDEKAKTVHVIDLKYGKGVPIDADNNSKVCFTLWVYCLNIVLFMTLTMWLFISINRASKIIAHGQSPPPNF